MTHTTPSIPWIEKYRPHNIDDLLVDKCTMTKIKRIIEEKNMPNIIITGIPGIGKTTTILCIAKYLMGKYFNKGVLELNASDDRGIKSVQELIINFCKKKLDLTSDSEAFSSHKLVLLDEADNMTKKAQQLISNVMGKYNETTRFAFTCNNSEDIIDAIQSRCIIMRYKRLSNKKLITRLKYICEEEHIPYSLDGLEALILVASGDMRQAINNLQTISMGYSNVTEENVFKICDKPHPLVIKQIFNNCITKNAKETIVLLKQLKDDGYTTLDIINNMLIVIKSSKLNDIDDSIKIKFFNELSKTAVIINKGYNSQLQLVGCICKLLL